MHSLISNSDSAHMYLDTQVLARTAGGNLETGVEYPKPKSIFQSKWSSGSRREWSDDFAFICSPKKAMEVT